MHIVIVSMQVKEDQIDAFVAATLRNVQATLKESGVRRFDLLRQADDPSRFLLFEVYTHATDQARHKESAHYRHWVEEVEHLLAGPRTRAIYDSASPLESGWE